jgi:hypothetical protein
MYSDIRISALSPDHSVMENGRQQVQRKRKEMNEGE